MKGSSLDSGLSRALGWLTSDPAERRNILWLSVSTWCYIGALALCTQVMLTAYLVKTGFSNTQIGFVTAAVQVTYTLGMFGFMGASDRIQRRIRSVMICAFIVAAGTVLLGVTTALPSSVLPGTALFLILVAVLCLQQPVMALLGMMQYSVLVRTIRVAIRGRVWGITSGTGAVISVGLGLLASVILKRFGYPYGFSLAVLAASVFWAVYGITINRQEELPDIALPGASRSFSPFTSIIDICKIKEFRMLAYPHVLRGLLCGAAVFIVPIQMKRLALPDEYGGYMTTAVAFAGFVGVVLFGLTNDRWGSGIVTMLGDLLAAGAWVGALLAPSPITFLLFLTLFTIGDIIEQNSIPIGSFEIVPTGVMGAFSAARLMILSGATALGSILAGHLLDIHGGAYLYYVFLVAAALKLGMGMWFLKVFGLRRRAAAPGTAAKEGSHECACHEEGGGRFPD